MYISSISNFLDCSNITQKPPNHPTPIFINSFTTLKTSACIYKTNLTKFSDLTGKSGWNSPLSVCACIVLIEI